MWFVVTGFIHLAQCFGGLATLQHVSVVCSFFFFFFFNFCLHWVFVAARGLSLVVASGAYSSLRCAGFSLWWLLVAEHRLQARGLQQLQHAGSVVMAPGLQSIGLVVVVHGLSCSVACGIFPDQGSNSCPLHWQADS